MKIFKFLGWPLIISIFLFPLVSNAFGLPFGGKIIFKQYCPCSGNWLISYLPTTATMPKLLSYRPGISTLYEYKSLEPGMQILGTTISPDVCLTAIFCIPNPLQAVLGVPFLIKMVGTSGLGHSAGSGSNTSTGGSNNSGTNPSNQTNPANPTNPNNQNQPNQPNGPSTGGGTNNNAELNTAQNEAQNRQTLADNGINVVSSGNCSDCSNSRCTCVGGTSQNALDGVTGLKQQCPGCQVTVNGSTETGHHDGCVGNCVDLGHNANLDSYIVNNAQNTTPVYNGGTFVGNRYTLPDGTTYLDEHAGAYGATTGSHWHVDYSSRKI